MNKGFLVLIIALFLVPVPLTAAPPLTVPDGGGHLSLQQALQIAMQRNPDIRTVLLQINEAEARLHLASVALNPTASAGLDVEDGGSSVTGQILGNGVESNAGSLSAQQLLSDFGRTRASLRAAAANLRAAKANLRTKREDTALTVEQQYYTAIGDGRLEAIDRDALADQKKHLEQAEGFYEIGTKARIDVAQAQATVATAQLTLVQAENSRRQDFVTLNNAMGLRSAAVYELEDTLADVRNERIASVPQISDVPPADDTDVLVARALKNRPEMVALNAQIESARYALDLARLGLAPTATSVVSYSLAQLAGQLTPTWSVEALMSFPLVDGGSTRYSTQVAEAQLTELLSQQESERNTIYSQVQQDVLNIRAAVAQITVATAGVDASKEAYRLADGRYQAGLGSSLDFLDAALAYSQSRSSLVTAEVGQKVAIVQLDRALGRDVWEEVGQGPGEESTVQ